jgi:hypothetical protein
MADATFPGIDMTKFHRPAQVKQAGLLPERKRQPHVIEGRKPFPTMPIEKAVRVVALKPFVATTTAGQLRTFTAQETGEIDAHRAEQLATLGKLEITEAVAWAKPEPPPDRSQDGPEIRVKGLRNRPPWFGEGKERSVCERIAVDAHICGDAEILDGKSLTKRGRDYHRNLKSNPSAQY